MCNSSFFPAKFEKIKLITLLETIKTEYFKRMSLEADEGEGKIMFHSIMSKSTKRETTILVAV